MSETCCEIHPPKEMPSNRPPCPHCGAPGKPVARITLGALLKPEARPRIPEGDRFWFCASPTCEAVYYRPEGTVFTKADLSVRVGDKEPDDLTVLVCYCFGWTPEKIRAEIQRTGCSTAADQIKAQVKAGNCYCEVTNPQGSCCLGNVAGAVQKTKERR